MVSPAILTSKNSSIRKLAECAKESYKRLSGFRQSRIALMKEYAGPYYGRAVEGVNWRLPLPLIYSIVSTIVPQVAMRTVHLDVTTSIRDLRPFAKKLGLMVEQVATEMRLAKTLRQAVTEAMWSMGLVKVGLGASAAAGMAESGENYWEDPGQVFGGCVDLDDYCIDHHTKGRESAAYEGDYYPVLYDWAMDSGVFEKAGRQELERIYAASSKPGGGEQQAAELGLGKRSKGEDEEYDRMIWLWDFWRPRHGDIITLPGDLDMAQRPIAETPWEGPECGPYHALGPHPLPSNPMPVPMIAVLFDLYQLLNRLANKTARQAERQKDVGIYAGSAEDTAANIKKAEDGELVRGDPAAVKVVSFGGANAEGYKATDFFYQFLQKVAGNPEVLGGLESQAGTLGQETMLLQQAGLRVNDFRNDSLGFAAEICQSIAWYIWTDPIMGRELALRLPGGETVPVRWDPDVREGNFLDYNFGIQPYSVAVDSPAQQYQRILDLIKNVIVPLAPVAATQGTYPDVGRLVADMAKKVNILDADEWWVEGIPTQQAMPRGPAGPGQTTNISLGRGGGTQPAQVPEQAKQAMEAAE